MFRLFVTLTMMSAICFGGAAKARNEFDVKTDRAWSGYAIPNGLWLSGDYTGDGRDDLMHVVANTDYVHPWISTGGGNFDVKTFRPWRGYGMPNGQWMNADFNGDGRMDIVHVVNGRDYVHPWASNGDGTFRVTTFRPWSGYAMPNGVWLVADLNGDRRDDLVHVVRDTDYVHTWLSNGNGTFRVGTFRPWRGYAMPNGEWRVGDFNGDGRDDLLHAVSGTDYVHTWTSRGDGRFTVGTFKPWNGYAIPNGEWHVGDFNGDERDDILHVVNATDYVHTWKSRGNGTFEVGTFRPWSGYAMPNGVWRVGDLDRDGKDDIVHAVAGTDYAHVWRSTTDHRFAVSTFSPWRGYAIPNGLWVTGDFDGDDREDVLHVVRGTNYLHPWLSRMPAPNEMAVDDLELTQTVQDMEHSVPLVAGKTTIARAYLNHNNAAARRVRGRMYVYNFALRRGVYVDSLNVASVNPNLNNQLRAKREATDGGLNFQIPATMLAQGQLYARLISLSDAGSGESVACSNCTTSRVVTLQAAAPLRVRIFGMRYTQNSTAHQPSSTDFNLIRSWLGRVYPTSNVQMTQLIVGASNAAPFTCNNINAQIAATRAVEVGNNVVDARTHYYGLVDDGGFFMRGCAAGIPGSPQPQTVSSGPTGSGDFGWDNDGSYGDWYTGHEFGHTFGRHHIGSGCGDSDSDSNYPYPNGQISGADGAFVGFDVGDSANGIAMRALPGTSWTDFMSYCRNQWVSDYTYKAILARLNAENALPGGPVPGGVAATETEEMPLSGAVHVTESEKTGTTGHDHATEAAVTPSGSPPLASEIEPDQIAAPDPSVLEPAYNVPPQVTHSGANPWVESQSEQIAFAGPLPPEMSDRNGPSPELAPEPVGPDLSLTMDPARIVTGQFLSVVGTVNLTAETGSIDFVNPVPRGFMSDEPVSGATIRLLNEQGEEIGRRDVPILLSSEQHHGEDRMGVIDALVPADPMTRSLVLELDGREIARRTVAGEESIPQSMISVAGVAGTATISVTLEDGFTTFLLEGAQISSLDSNFDYKFEISTDGGDTWQVIALGLKTPIAGVDLSGLDAGETIQVRAAVNTGLATRIVSEREFTVE